MVSQRKKNKNLEFDILLLLSSLGIGLKFIKIKNYAIFKYFLCPRAKHLSAKLK